eukprot:GHVN01036224.1.p1 GENE.GHVN01036224.1~~GHVN01036224.1.p1  ORF type:complete len:283 (-),score=-14.07 GHVN01036224.1:1668-2516(-)
MINNILHKFKQNPIQLKYKKFVNSNTSNINNNLKPGYIKLFLENLKKNLIKKIKSLSLLRSFSYKVKLVNYIFNRIKLLKIIYQNKTFFGSALNIGKIKDYWILKKGISKLIDTIKHKKKNPSKSYFPLYFSKKFYNTKSIIEEAQKIFSNALKSLPKIKGSILTKFKKVIKKRRRFCYNRVRKLNKKIRIPIKSALTIKNKNLAAYLIKYRIYKLKKKIWLIKKFLIKLKSKKLLLELKKTKLPIRHIIRFKYKKVKTRLSGFNTTKSKKIKNKKFKLCNL